MRIGVFCSANDAIDKDFIRLTEELGCWIANAGHTLVYGGCDIGLMRVIGQTVHRFGGRTIGIVPRIIEPRGDIADCLDVWIPVENLSERKDLMLAKSDIMIALPGGIGTLDEIFTVAAANTIGYHNKRVILYNMKNFWDFTLLMLRRMEEKGMIRGRIEDFFTVASTLEEVMSAINTTNPEPCE
ncbi:MAG: TIGR00730 family Rossman fold protein [Prevotella sp.]|nr:TIGR00730 family Rossman fold protein [Prevotella sp.]